MANNHFCPVLLPPNPVDPPVEEFVMMLRRVANVLDQFDGTNVLTSMRSVLANQRAGMETNAWLSRMYDPSRRSNYCSEIHVMRSEYHIEKAAIAEAKLILELNEIKLNRQRILPVDYHPTSHGIFTPETFNFLAIDHLGPNPAVLFGEQTHLKGASMAISLERNAAKGRHYVAAVNIPIDSVLFSELPYSIVKSPGFVNDNCDHCWKLIPNMYYICDGCTISHYCSEECKALAVNGVHAFECSGIKMEVFKGTRTPYLAFHTFLIGASENVPCGFGMSLADCQRPYEDLESIVCCIERSVTGDYKRVYELLGPMHNMMSNGKEYALGAVTFMMYLRDYTQFFSFFSNIYPRMTRNVMQELIAFIILKHMYQMDVNATPIIRFGKKNPHQIVGHGIFPSVSMMNHSCVPNVFSRVTDEGRYVGVAGYNIAAGMDLSVCYDIRNNLFVKSLRSDIIKRQYAFICRCVACK